jgi:hypothetical protein
MQHLRFSIAGCFFAVQNNTIEFVRFSLESEMQHHYIKKAKQIGLFLGYLNHTFKDGEKNYAK